MSFWFMYVFFYYVISYYIWDNQKTKENVFGGITTLQVSINMLIKERNNRLIQDIWTCYEILSNNIVNDEDQSIDWWKMRNACFKLLLNFKHFGT
eukprot:UN00273